jgi:hypothetical protein
MARITAAEQKKHNTRQFSNPLYSGMRNILNQNYKECAPISQEVLAEDIKKMVKKAQEGDTSALITMLTTNILQPIRDINRGTDHGEIRST